MNTNKYTIETTWNNQKIKSGIKVKIGLSQAKNEPNMLHLNIIAPFNDSEKPNKTVSSFFNLWDYEGKFIFSNLTSIFFT
jgi:hypothetical protein